jgi:hypothetical protein
MRFLGEERRFAGYKDYTEGQPGIPKVLPNDAREPYWLDLPICSHGQLSVLQQLVISKRCFWRDLSLGVKEKILVTTSSRYYNIFSEELNKPGELAGDEPGKS